MRVDESACRTKRENAIKDFVNVQEAIKEEV